MADGTAPAPGQAAPNVEGTQGDQGDNRGEHPPASPRFSRDAYLSSLPEDERTVKAGLPDFILERDAQRGMLRSDYDRKRMMESRELSRLQGQVEALMQGQNGNGQAPDPADLVKQGFEAETPEQWGEAVGRIVEQRVGQVVDEVLGSHPVLRQVGQAAAMQQARGPGRAVSDEVFLAGQQSLENQLAHEGVDPAALDPAALRILLQPHLELAQARLGGQSKQQVQGDNQPAPSSEPRGHVTLPVRGSGTGGGMPAAPSAPAGTQSKDPVGDAVSRIHQRMGLSEEQVAELRKNT